MRKIFLQRRSAVSNRYKKWRLLFIVILVMRPVVASEMEVKPYQIKEGAQYQLCRDLVPYIQKSQEIGGGKPPIFIIEDDKFKAPKWKKESQFIGLKILMQVEAYLTSNIERWKSIIEWLEKKLRSSFVAESTKVNLNNEGDVESVLRISWFDERLNSMSYLSYPLNEFGNLAVDMYRDEKVSLIIGEIFLYKGRTFSLKFYGDEIYVGEHRPSAMRDKGGLSILPSVCHLVLPESK